MEQASKYALLTDRPNESCDTNILTINFEIMKSWKSHISPKPPVTCGNCLSVLSSLEKLRTSEYITNLNQDSYSQIKPTLISSFLLEDLNNINKNKAIKKKLTSKNKQKISKILEDDEDSDEDEDVDEDGTPKVIPFRKKQIKKEVKLSEIQKTHSYRICKFCGNISNFETVHIPKTPDIFFILSEVNYRKPTNTTEDISVIFCLDNSGSMSSTLEIESRNFVASVTINNQELESLKMALSSEEYAEQLQAIQRPRQQTHLTRKNCITQAIQKELNKMKNDFPFRKIGIVIFNDEVIIAGDGHSHVKQLTGNCLIDYEQCLQVGKASGNMMNETISENYATVTHTYLESPEKGKTALGPALVAAVGLASAGKPGSMVILCTDGLANLGLGDLTINDINQTRLYEKIADFAADVGININVMTIAGERCRTDILGKLVEKTNGNIERVNPSIMSNEIQGMLADNILGRKAIITMYLPNYLKFIKEDARFLSEGGSVCRKEIGNLSENTRIYFRYGLKKYVFQCRKKEFKDNMPILFQAQIKYMSLDGLEVFRVITAQFPATFSEETAFLNGNMALVANYAASEVANLYGDMKEEDILLRRNYWNVLMDNIREIKKKKNRLEEGEENSIKSFKRDFADLEEMTMKRKNQKKQMRAQKIDQIEEENDDENTMVMKMKKRNYK